MHAQTGDPNYLIGATINKMGDPWIGYSNVTVYYEVPSGDKPVIISGVSPYAGGTFVTGQSKFNFQAGQRNIAATVLGGFTNIYCELQAAQTPATK